MPVLRPLLLQTDKKGNTILHIALSQGHKDLVPVVKSVYSTETLVKALMIKNVNGFSPMQGAIGKSQMKYQPHNIAKFVEELPAQTRMEVLSQSVSQSVTSTLGKIQFRHINRIDHEGETLIHTVIACENWETYLRTLLPVFSNTEIYKLLSIQNRAGETPLHLAARKFGIFEVLLSTLTELAAYPSTVDDGTSALLTLLGKQNVIGETVVHKAAGYEPETVVPALKLLHQVELIDLLTILNHHGETAILEAVLMRNVSFLESILEIFEAKAFNPSHLVSSQDSSGSTP